MQDVKLGKQFDEEGESISDVEEVLKKHGITLRDSAGTFRDMGDVLDDTMKKWNELAAQGKSVEQSELAKVFAGTRQANVFRTLMNNQEMYVKALKVEEEAIGTLNERYEIFIDNVEASGNRAKAGWEEVWEKTFSEDTIILVNNTSAAIAYMVVEGGGLVDVLKEVYDKGMKVAMPFLMIMDAIETFKKIFSKEGRKDLQEMFNIFPDIVKDNSQLFKNIAEFIPDKELRESILRNIDALNMEKEALFSNEEAMEDHRATLYNATEDQKKLSDSTEEVSSSMEERLNKSLKESTEIISSTTSGYSALTDALTTYNETGSITLDQAQSLIDAGYGEAVSINQLTGEVSINTYMMRAMAIAKADAAILALTNQLNIYKETAAVEAQEAPLRRNIALWEGKKKLLNKAGSDSASLLKAISGFSGGGVPSGGGGGGSQNTAEKMYQDLLAITIKMLKQKKEAEKDALKAQLDGYKKIIDAQKDLLQLQHDEKEYQDDLAEQNKVLSDLDNELLQLQFDNSEEGKRRRLELEEERAEQTKEIDKMQADNTLEIQKNALDKEYEDYKAMIDAKIAALDNYLGQTGTITRDAMALLSSHSDSVYQSLLDWNRQYGDGVDSTISKLWNMEGALVGVGNAASYANSMGVPASSVRASALEKGLTRYGEGLTYHDGGIVGEIPNIKESEMYAKLLKGEVVANDSQMKNYMNNTLPNLIANVGGSVGGIGDISMIFHIAGSLDKTVLPNIKKMVTEVMMDSMSMKGYRRNASSYSI